MKVWITKYALTKGIIEKECEPNGDLGKDWHNTKDNAIAEAERMRDAKVASLRKQIAKLDALSFDA